MRVVAFGCLLLQSFFVLYDASWKRTSWPYTAAGGLLALTISLWAHRQRVKREDHNGLSGHRG